MDGEKSREKRSKCRVDEDEGLSSTRANEGHTNTPQRLCTQNSKGFSSLGSPNFSLTLLAYIWFCNSGVLLCNYRGTFIYPCCELFCELTFLKFTSMSYPMLISSHLFLLFISCVMKSLQNFWVENPVKSLSVWLILYIVYKIRRERKLINFLKFPFAGSSSELSYRILNPCRITLILREFFCLFLKWERRKIQNVSSFLCNSSE